MTELIVALDVPGIEDARGWADKLGDAVCWYKVGMELFTRKGAAVVKMLRDRGKNIFLDLKFHDIPRTVSRAVERGADIGVQLMTIHAVGGRAMMEAAAEKLVNRSSPPKLVGVTVLTSMDAAALKEVGIRRSPKGWVTDLAMLAQDCGLDGVVASPREIKGVRSACGQGFSIVTPGIRPRGAETQDQRRVATPALARKWGADFIVVGRPILEADDPLQAVTKITKELSR